MDKKSSVKDPLLRKLISNNNQSIASPIETIPF